MNWPKHCFHSITKYSFMVPPCLQDKLKFFSQKFKRAFSVLFSILPQYKSIFFHSFDLLILSPNKTCTFLPLYLYSSFAPH